MRIGQVRVRTDSPPGRCAPETATAAPGAGGPVAPVPAGSVHLVEQDLPVAAGGTP